MDFCDRCRCERHIAQYRNLTIFSNDLHVFTLSLSIFIVLRERPKSFNSISEFFNKNRIDEDRTLFSETDRGDYIYSRKSCLSLYILRSSIPKRKFSILRNYRSKYVTNSRVIQNISLPSSLYLKALSQMRRTSVANC